MANCVGRQLNLQLSSRWQPYSGNGLQLVLKKCTYIGNLCPTQIINQFTITTDVAVCLIYHRSSYIYSVGSITCLGRNVSGSIKRGSTTRCGALALAPTTRIDSTPTS